MNQGTNKEQVQTQLPIMLLKRAEAYIAEGWSDSLESLLVEALRRYLDTHQVQLNERFIRDDVEWGLHGED